MVSKRERKLGFIEDLYHYAHDYAGGCGITVAVAKLKGDIDQNNLKKAFTNVHDLQPMLQSRIKSIDTSNIFQFDVPFENICYKVKTQISANQWKIEVENEMLNMFDVSQSLWRVLVLSDDINKEHEIIITFHHAIMDGISFSALLKQLLDYYDGFVNGNNSNEYIQAKIYDSIECLLNKEVSFETYMQQSSQVDNSIYAEWKYHNKISLGKQKSKNIYFNINKNPTKKIIQWCRLNNLTVNSYLNAVLLIAINKVNESASIILHTPVNLRNFCKTNVSNNALGCFISIAKTEHRASSIKRTIKETALHYQSQLQEYKDRQCFLPVKHDSNFLKKLFSPEKINGRDHFAGGMAISNLGEVNFDYKYKNLSVENIYFAASSLSGIGILVFHVLTFNEKMHFSVNYTSPLLKRSWVNTLLNVFKESLLENI